MCWRRMPLGDGVVPVVAEKTHCPRRLCGESLCTQLCEMWHRGVPVHLFESDVSSQLAVGLPRGRRRSVLMDEWRDQFFESCVEVGRIAR
ncbi:hypothetical protein OBBRIDRAFT_121117 [Obba rivulosa]|uniref:Uncharacterized protein n=1 Tax=Obba rivulosa TaxID=1052685 RepID=A0A8E2J6N1_9APHY|nr:hypothetical protein OBBRIDRAFT_121117 [Obba rivulosa]